MAETCEYCGNKVLATDTVCWHCGRQLSQRPATQAPASRPSPLVRRSSAAATAAPEEANATVYDFRAILAYGLLTAIIFIALLLLMHALGRRPLLVSGADLRLGADWTTVTDSELRYTLSLPAGWQWLDGAFRQQQALVDEVARREPNVARSLAPLGETTGDLALIAIGLLPETAESGDSLTFVAVGRSVQLAQLSPEQVLAVLAEQALPLSSTALVEHLPGQPQARFGWLDSAQQLQCRNLFVAQGAAGYLLAACAPQEQFGRVQRDLEEILDSFQLLQHD
jgi:hypothetical protein